MKLFRVQASTLAPMSELLHFYACQYVTSAEVMVNLLQLECKAKTKTSLDLKNSRTVC